MYNVECKSVLKFVFFYLQPRLVILTKATLAIMAIMETMETLAIITTQITATIKQYFEMMPTLKLDNKLVHQITSIINQKVSNVLLFDQCRIEPKYNVLQTVSNLTG